MLRRIAPIRPPQHEQAPRFSVQFVLNGKIIRQPFGHDPLMTPVRIPAGVNPHPFSSDPIAFEPGATLDVAG